MSSLKAVFFDLGYTLVRSPREEQMAILCAEHGCPRTFEQLSLDYIWTDRYFFAEYPGLLARSPSEWYEHYLTVLFDRMGVALNPAQIKAEIFRRFPPRVDWVAFPETLPALNALRAEGLRLGLISNWDATARSVLNQTGLRAYFDPIVISSEVGMEKPDPAIFRHALSLSGLAPAEAVYVGDNYHDDVVGAAHVGMEAILVDRFSDHFGPRFDCPHIRTLTDLVTLLRVRKLTAKNREA